jgi:hypothetical protein
MIDSSTLDQLEATLKAARTAGRGQLEALDDAGLLMTAQAKRRLRHDVYGELVEALTDMQAWELASMSPDQVRQAFIEKLEQLRRELA